MIDEVGEDRDLSVLAVLASGAVEAGTDLLEPVRLIDDDGEPVAAVTAFLRELQASGRSAATQRSYAMDLLRWFRFGWAIGVGWHQATRVEAAGLLPVAGVAGQAEPGRFQHRSGSSGAERRDRQVRPVAEVRRVDASAFGDGAAGVLRLPSRRRDGPMVNPFPLSRERRGGRRLPPVRSRIWRWPS